jgi:hypothetical protein
MKSGSLNLLEPSGPVKVCNGIAFPFLLEISKRKANSIDHILRRNCLLRQVVEGKIKEGREVKGRRGRIRRKLLDDLK